LGFPKNSEKRIFQVFQRFHPSKAQGEGMGLATVKRIIEKHNGQIWLDSQEGIGSTFHFKIPNSKEPKGNE
jgi:signal transduction histidine kinase